MAYFFYFMCIQVLSIKQCKELLALNLDMSNASALWVSNIDENYNPTSWLAVFRNDPTSIEVLREKFPLTYKDGNIFYTYTLQDILNKLKINIVNKKEWETFKMSSFDIINNSISFVKYWYDGKYNREDVLFTAHGKDLIETAFIMLKWCIEHNYFKV